MADETHEVEPRVFFLLLFEFKEEKKRFFFFNIGGDGCVNKIKMGILKSARRSPVERDNPFLCVCVFYAFLIVELDHRITKSCNCV